MREPAKPAPGKRRKSAGDLIAQTATLATITERQKKLALQAKARRPVRFSAKAKDLIRALDLAERFDEDEHLVHRACWLYGLTHYEQWASGQSPFSEFAAVPKRGQDDIRPAQPPFLRPQDDFNAPPAPVHDPRTEHIPPVTPPRAPTIAADAPPPPRTVTRQEIEAVHTTRVQVGKSNVPLRGLLPGGHTEETHPYVPPGKYDEGDFERENEEFFNAPPEIPETPAPVETVPEVPRRTPSEVAEDLVNLVLDPAITGVGQDDFIVTEVEPLGFGRPHDPTPAPAATTAPAKNGKHPGGRPRKPRCADCGQTERGGDHGEGGHEFMEIVAESVA